MKDYKGKRFEFDNKEFEVDLKLEGVSIEDGEEGVILCTALYGPTFESTYFDIQLDRGEVYFGISGYHLDVNLNPTQRRRNR